MSGFECWWTHHGSDVCEDIPEKITRFVKSVAKYAWESSAEEQRQSADYMEGYEVGYRSGWQHQQALDAQLCESMDVCDGYGKMFADAIRGKK